MRDFWLVFKTIYKSNVPRKENSSGEKSKLPQGAKLALAFSPLLLMVCAVLVFLCTNLKNINELALIITAIVAITQIITLFLSIYGVINTLYESKDTPFLSTLPIRPSAVFFAKFALTYVEAFKLSTFIIMPLSLTCAISYNIASGQMFYAFYPLVLSVLAFAPILPLFVVTLFSMPIVWLGSYFKGRPTLKSILSIVFYIVLTCAYMVIVFFMNTTGLGQEGDIALSSGAISSLLTLSYVFYPDKALVNFVLGIDFGKNLGISAAIIIGMIVVMLVLSMLFYRRITIKNAEGVKASEVKGTSLKQKGIVASLIKKDVSAIMRSSSLAMSSFANLILAPIFIVLMYFITGFKENVDDMSALTLEMLGIGFVIMYSMIFLGGANMLANIAYTREGKSFFATKSLPISAKDSIKSKLLLAVIAAAVMLIPIMLIELLLYKIDVVCTLFTGIDVMMLVVGVCSLGILFDMKKGNIYWETSRDLSTASHNNTYQIISTFVAIIPAIIIFTAGILLSVFANTLGEVVVKVIYFLIATILSVVVMIVGLSLLKTYGESWYKYVGENKTSLKQKKSKAFGGVRLIK